MAENEVKETVGVEEEPVKKKTTRRATTKASVDKEEKKPAAKKAAAEKKTTRKTAAEKKVSVKEAGTEEKKPAAKRIAAKKAEPVASVMIQYGASEVAAKKVVAAAIDAYKAAHEGAEVKTIEVYIKPEENAAYYVVNGDDPEGNNRIDLF